MTNELTAERLCGLADYHFIDMWRRLRGAGRSNREKAQAAAEYLAGEIIALIEREARMREALERLCDCEWTINPYVRKSDVQNIARAALQPEPNDRKNGLYESL